MKLPVKCGKCKKISENPVDWSMFPQLDFFLCPTCTVILCKKEEIQSPNPPQEEQNVK